jgi:hypothetical protein
MALDLSTAANIASLICLPATFVSGTLLFASLFDEGRQFMVKYKSIPVIIISLILVIGILDLLSRVGWLGSSELETIFNQTYINQTVTINNKDFYNCEFENVTIRFNGGPFKIDNSRFHGTIRLETTNREVDRTFVLTDAVYRSTVNMRMIIIPKPEN